MRTRLLLFAIPLLVASCSGGGDDPEAATTTAAPATTTTAPAPVRLKVLVTNDDGVGAPGIDALVEALRADPTLDLVVVAPAVNQSGAGDVTTEGATAAPATTASGFDAVAVAGKPADAVNHALDVVLAAAPPDLVISGITEGQNLGPIVAISGTVGAARTASRRGIPSLAVSQGLAAPGGTPDYAAGVEAALAWLEDNRAALETGLVVSVNVPTCTAGEIRGTVEVPVAADASTGDPVQVADCTSTSTDLPTDIAAFNAGYITVSEPGLG